MLLGECQLMSSLNKLNHQMLQATSNSANPPHREKRMVSKKETLIPDVFNLEYI